MFPVLSVFAARSRQCGRHAAVALCSLRLPCFGVQPSGLLDEMPRRMSSWTSMFKISGGESTSASPQQHQQPALGLFGRAELQRPQDWQRIADDTEAHCDMLLASIMDTSPSDGVLVVTRMDEMSDTLCRAYDAAECCRNVHSDPQWRAAAERVCVQLGAYIARVNSHTGMYERLTAALAAFEDSIAALARRETPKLGPWQLGGWCRESVLVAQRLKQDMEQAGIHLPSDERERVAQLAAANGHFASAFNAALTNPSKVGRVSVGIGRYMVLEPGAVAGMLATEPREELRRQVYMAAGASPQCNRQLLNDMIAVRRELAAAQGYPSYTALRTASGSLAASPTAVVAFLQQLASGVREMAEAELQTLARLKASDRASTSLSRHLAPWDVEYYAAAARRAAASSPPSAFLRFTSVPSVLTGVAALLRRLLGVVLEVHEAAPGEGWAPGVLRCVASRKDLGQLGTIYLDLEDRPGKYPSAVTFPLTCGRQLPLSEGGGRQLPSMALLAPVSGTCPSTRRPAFTPRELRVFLHELGHCLHNLLSTTKYQHLWGTRCAQDLVELPSHLFEYFAADPRSMALIARDRSVGASGAVGSWRAEDGEPIPPGLLREVLCGRAATACLELQQQLVVSLADQWLFGEEAGEDTSEVWKQAVEAASSVPFVPGTSPERRIGHLTIYGGAYYSYVYARCLAAHLWRSLGLADDPLNPAAGTLLRERLLAPGGSLEPLHLLGGLSEDHSKAGAASGGAGASGRSSAGSAVAGGLGLGCVAAAAARGMRLEPSQVAAALQRGADAAVGSGGLLVAGKGGYAPRVDRYLEALAVAKEGRLGPWAGVV